MREQNHRNVIKIRNAYIHNLKHIDVDIPLNKIVGMSVDDESDQDDATRMLRFLYGGLHMKFTL